MLNTPNKRAVSSSEEALITSLPTVICEAPSSDADDNERHTRLLFKPTWQSHRNKRGNQETPSRLMTSQKTDKKSRDQKFHRQFKELPNREQLIDYFSCALITDVILQGHLYLTSTHFAFHSNVFGFVTKLLIPTSSVTNITKERTAYIIPNAIAIFTKNRKHVFGTLLARDATFKILTKAWKTYMAQSTSIDNKEDTMMEKNSRHTNNKGNVWRAALDKNNDFDDELIISDDDDDIDDNSSISGSSCCSTRMPITPERLSPASAKRGEKAPVVRKPPKGSTSRMKMETTDQGSQTMEPASLSWLRYMRQLPSSDLWLLSSTILLTLLFLSAGILLNRISILHHKYAMLQEPLLDIREDWEIKSQPTKSIDK